jgi:RNA polymerase-binding transcription factor DksA
LRGGAAIIAASIEEGHMPTPKKAATKAAPVKKPPAAKAEPEAAPKAPARKAAATTESSSGPAVKGVSKDGIAYTKDFDVKFLTSQKALLLAEKQSLTGQAVRLEDEANSLIEDGEMGDVEFGDEGGEGDTMVVERERDLALSAQARQTIADIDAALARLAAGTYGYSVESGRPIPRERLEAIPWATVLVEEKVGGIGRR